MSATLGTRRRHSYGDGEDFIAVHMLQDPISDCHVTPAWGKGTKSGSASIAAAPGASVRRLTPTECERLQALPDGWTDFGPGLEALRRPRRRRYRFGCRVARTPNHGGRMTDQGCDVNPITDWTPRIWNSPCDPERAGHHQEGGAGAPKRGPQVAESLSARR